MEPLLEKTPARLLGYLSATSGKPGYGRNPAGVPCARPQHNRVRPEASESLARRAYRAIRTMILSRRLTGGEILLEERLASELSISRTPVREALLLLQSEGLIEKQMNQPFRVRIVSNREYFQTMRLRELLEGEATAMATGKIDREAIDWWKLTCWSSRPIRMCQLKATGPPMKSCMT